MKKQFLIFGVIGLFSIMLVSGAIIQHYGLFESNLEVIQPISVEGNLENDLGIVVLDEYPKFIWGDKVTIFNGANKSIEVQIISDNNESEINTRYVYSENGFDMINFTSNDITLIINGNSNVSFYPQFAIGSPLESGEYTITTSINPVV